MFRGVARRASQQTTASGLRRATGEQDGGACRGCGLDCFRLGSYAAVFEEEGIDDVEYLLEVSADAQKLQRLIGPAAMKPGHAAKLGHMLQLEAAARA